VKPPLYPGEKKLSTGKLVQAQLRRGSAVGRRPLPGAKHSGEWEVGSGQISLPASGAPGLRRPAPAPPTRRPDPQSRRTFRVQRSAVQLAVHAEEGRRRGGGFKASEGRTQDRESSLTGLLPWPQWVAGERKSFSIRHPP